MYKDYYKTLGVPKTATQDEIKKSYRKLARTHHPDRNKGKPEAEERFKEINEAYAVLSDPEKRSVYDTYGTDRPSPPPPPGGWDSGPVSSGFDPGDFSEFFRNLFGGGFGGFTQDGFDQRSQPRQPIRQDVSGVVNVSLTEAYRGTSRTVEIDGKRLEFRVPPGAHDGLKLRLTGQAPGGGNVLLSVHIESDPVFQLETDQIRTTAQISPALALLGGKITVSTLDGPVEVNVPARSQNNRALRLRGLGWPRRDGSRGDQLVTLQLRVPTNPSEQELELYKALLELEGQVKA